MPNTKSATKALRQSVTRRSRNLAIKANYKDAVKDFRKTAQTSAKEAVALLQRLQQKVDKAAKSGVIKKNKAARLKSKAAKLLAKVSK